MTRAQQILALLKQNGTMSMPDIAEATGLPPKQAHWYLTCMRQDGLIVRHGVRRKYLYSTKSRTRPVSSVFDLGLPA